MNTGRIAEELLFHGYGGMLRVEPCACGSFVAARTGGEQAAVYAHNCSEMHQAWRAWMRLRDEAPGPDVLVMPLGQLELT